MSNSPWPLGGNTRTGEVRSQPSRREFCHGKPPCQVFCERPGLLDVLTAPGERGALIGDIGPRQPLVLNVGRLHLARADVNRLHPPVDDVRTEDSVGGVGNPAREDQEQRERSHPLGAQVGQDVTEHASLLEEIGQASLP